MSTFRNQSVAENLAHVINMRLHDPLFWLQFAVIAGVFVLARWLLTPLLRKGNGWRGLHPRAQFPPAIGGPDRGRQPDRMADAAVDRHRASSTMPSGQAAP